MANPLPENRSNRSCIRAHILATANNSKNNLRPPFGSQVRLVTLVAGTRHNAGYVLETADGGKELADALVSIARGVMPNVPVHGGNDQQ